MEDKNFLSLCEECRKDLDCLDCEVLTKKLTLVKYMVSSCISKERCPTCRHFENNKCMADLEIMERGKKIDK